MHLPVETVLAGLSRALAESRAAVLQAPPGAGKTTLVPLALLDAPWLAGRSIVMLEPRRLAARAAALRMAALRDEPVGGTVGYRMRGDTRVGPATRIEVVTEGILTRRLATDPAIDGVGLVIFDEFHERSLPADTGLALTLQARSLLRDDLRLLVMSATLDGAAVAALLGGAPVISCDGRIFPVETTYLPRRPDQRVEGAAASAIRHALARDAGDILVFLPGAGEVNRVRQALGDLGAGVIVAPLHGSLPPGEQDRALTPAPAGRRKVVLATSIAQTSLTIEGVRVVIDGGLARVPRFSPRSGMTRLETVRVSRASADQRRGRAGRLGPGVCYRLWAEAEQAQLLPHDTPEMLEADLAPLALDMAAAGSPDPAELAWLDPPPAAAYARARELLGQLDAVDPAGRITPRGRRMAALPLHPRLAHMLLEAGDESAGTATALAALLADRDPVRAEHGPPHADLRLRLELLGSGSGAAVVHGYDVDHGLMQRIRREAAELRRRTAAPGGAQPEPDAAGRVLAHAYPDRIAQRRPGPGGRYQLTNGGGAALIPGDPLWDEPYLVVAETDGRRPESRIVLAAPISIEEIEAVAADRIGREEIVEWDGAAGMVLARRRVRLGALVLRDAPLLDPDPVAVTAALLGGVRADGVDRLPWSDAARRLRERVAFLRTLDERWPDLSDQALALTLDDWFAPRLAGLRRRDQLAAVDLAGALVDRLTWEQRAALDVEAPTHIVVPTGSRIPVDYADRGAPVLAVRLQELFGLADTPTVGGGRVPLVLHLLSPAHRPVQVTRDLAGFWRTSYFDVRKDLRGRYPRHPWPDDPLAAAPTRRAKPKGS